MVTSTVTGDFLKVPVRKDSKSDHNKIFVWKTPS